MEKVEGVLWQRVDYNSAGTSASSANTDIFAGWTEQMNTALNTGIASPSTFSTDFSTAPISKAKHPISLHWWGVSISVTYVATKR